jgi:hypothetical protein
MDEIALLVLGSIGVARLLFARPARRQSLVHPRR